MIKIATDLYFILIIIINYVCILNSYFVMNLKKRKKNYLKFFNRIQIDLTKESA